MINVVGFSTTGHACLEHACLLWSGCSLIEVEVMVKDEVRLVDESMCLKPGCG